MNEAASNRERAQELKAGLFVIVGLVAVAFMAFKFGRLGQGLFQSYYPLSVTFPSADGIIKNSDVQLAGARVGYVAEKPAIEPGGSGVIISLKILSYVKIPRKTVFQVDSSGLLGDKFVDISPAPDFDAKTYNPADSSEVLAPGQAVTGEVAGGPLGGIETKAEAVFDLLKVEIEKLTVVTDKINEGILSPQNQQSITDTFTNLKGTSEHFNVASKDLDGVILNARTTLGTVNAAADDMRTALDDVQTTLASAQSVLKDAQTGKGPVAALLNDGDLTVNLKALIENLREHGILFYKNRANNAKDGPAASPAPATRTDNQF